MTFEEWWPSYYGRGNKWQRDCAKAAWNYQQVRIEALEKALIKLRDCDWTITLPDRMDAVRDIARQALLQEPTK